VGKKENTGSGRAQNTAENPKATQNTSNISFSTFFVILLASRVVHLLSREIYISVTRNLNSTILERDDLDWRTICSMSPNLNKIFQLQQTPVGKTHSTS